MSLVTRAPVTVGTVRPFYVLQQLEVIYAMAWTQSWDTDQDVGVMNQLLDTERLVVHLNRIWVPKPLRNRKYGHTLLRHICQDADHADVVLTLEIDPDDPNDFKWIQRMYTHAGFKQLAEEYGPRSMVRWPAS